VATHVESYDDVLSDAGSTPAASTNLRSRMHGYRSVSSDPFNVAFHDPTVGESCSTLRPRISASQIKVAPCLLFLRRMKQNTSNDEAPLQRDPDEWKTGDEPMTAAQRSYLETLARESGEQINENLTKAEASKKIDELRRKSPRLAD